MIFYLIISDQDKKRSQQWREGRKVVDFPLIISSSSTLYMKIFVQVSLRLLKGENMKHSGFQLKS